MSTPEMMHGSLHIPGCKKREEDGPCTCAFKERPQPQDHAATWALADKIMSISYRYAVAMHESITAGRGASGWQDFKQAAEITTVLAAAFSSAPTVRTFRQTAADALADACERAVRARKIDARSEIGDALLDYRDERPCAGSGEGRELTPREEALYKCWQDSKVEGRELREAAEELLGYCEVASEGETGFERAVMRLRRALRQGDAEGRK